MSAVSSYQIISGFVTEQYRFEDLVSLHMRHGWIPTGGVTTKGDNFYQAMKRPMVEVTGLDDHGTRWEAT